MQETQTLYQQFGTDLNLIKKYFDELNTDKSHYNNSNDICTPMDLVQEMVDKIPEDFWRKDNLKILDCCCGNGNFNAYISTKVPLSYLYFNEINEKRIKNLEHFFGTNINLTKQDFLMFDENQTYDLIVANPPYAKFTEDGKRTAKNHNLSRDFIRKALSITKENGYILFVVPDNWMSFSDSNDLPCLLSNYQFKYLSIHTAKKYFKNVGSTFTYFLLQKTENKEAFIVENGYKIHDTQFVMLDKNIHFIPLYYSPIVKNILDKTINNEKVEKYKVETSSYLHKYTKSYLFSNEESESHPYKVWHTPRQYYFTSIPHKFQDSWKVFISLTTQFETFIDNCGMTQSIAFIQCKNKEEAIQIEKELHHPLYQFLNNITRYGNFGNNRIWQRMPILTAIKLTEEELEFVNHFNQIYNQKKSKKKEKNNEKK